MTKLVHDLEFEPRYGEAVRLSPLVRRITAGNPSPFTFHGTNTYLIGEKSLAVVDPGPDLPDHLAAILDAAGDVPITHILITHTHRDHSPASRPLKEKTGAVIYGEGPHRPSRPLDIGETMPLDAGGDTDFVPDEVLRHGDMIDGQDWTVEAVFTPGHTANHMCLALNDERALFSGDHVMGWSTTIVAPPDGAMADYMASIDLLLSRNDEIYYPAHGNPINDPQAYVSALKVHRLGREAAVLAQIQAGTATIPEMVRAIYVGLDERLIPAAGLSVLGHIEDLVTRGQVTSSVLPPSVHARFFI